MLKQSQNTHNHFSTIGFQPLSNKLSKAAMVNYFYFN